MKSRTMTTVRDSYAIIVILAFSSPETILTGSALTLFNEPKNKNNI